MTVEIHVDRYGDAVLAGRVVDGRLTDLLADRTSDASRVGAVLAGRIDQADPATGRLWVWVGEDERVLVASRAYAPGVVTAGRPVRVQITVDPTQDKLAEATFDIALPGRYLVHRPGGNGIAAARAVPADRRASIGEALPAGGGWVLRSAAADAPLDAIAAEAALLKRMGLRLRHAESTVGSVLLSGPSPAQRLILDTVDAQRIVADGPDAAALRPWLTDRAPDLADSLATDPAALIETLPALLAPDVALPGGGRLWIERTRALTAIDIDGPDPSRANWDAVTAIPRQLRLRNIGGLIVIDFAGSPSRPEPLLGRLRDGFDGDSASVRFGGGISALGVADLARQRRGRSLADVFPDGAP